MHRSGSSLIARLFFEAGANLGNSNTFYPGDKWNPHGYYEQQKILEINTSLINGIWNRLAYLKLPSKKTILKRAVRLSAKIKQSDLEYRDKIIKENRFCITLPAWLEHGAEIEKILICIREPYHVAKSLRQRNKIPLWLGYKLWHEHYQRMQKYMDAIPTRTIYYDKLTDPDYSVEELSAALQYFDVNLPAEEIENLCMNIINSKPIQNSPETVDYPAPVRSLWDDLIDSHQKQHSISSK